jgi:hypothetical protein
MNRRRYTEELTKSLISRRISTLIAGIIIFFIWGCQTNGPKKLEEMVTGKRGQSWDMVYVMKRYRTTPGQGFFFRPDGKFYSYRYSEDGQTRIPFWYGMWDNSTQPTIAANLQPWKLLGDSVLQFNSIRFAVKSIDMDTIILLTGAEKNPVIKLARVE